MNISVRDVEHVANLARLALTDAEKEQYTEQLNKILGFAAELQSLDIENVRPTSHPFELTNVTREDRSREWLSHEQALANAPDSDEGQFLVPAVMEG